MIGSLMLLPHGVLRVSIRFTVKLVRLERYYVERGRLNSLCGWFLQAGAGAAFGRWA